MKQVAVDPLKATDAAPTSGRPRWVCSRPRSTHWPHSNRTSHADGYRCDRAVFDSTLDARRLRIAGQWREAAEAIDSQGGEHLEEYGPTQPIGSPEADQIQAILDEIHIDADMLDLPELPEGPGGAELDGDRPDPLLDSRWDFVVRYSR